VHVHAQTTQPQFLVTWQASNSYIPTFYQGKALPNSQSKITASFNLFANNKLVDVSGQTVYWYLNDVLIGGGTGKQQITFNPFGVAPNTLTLKIELPDYPGGALDHSLPIPLVRPEAVIYAPYVNNTVNQTNFSLEALPYFFNASSVNPFVFGWVVNGQPVTNVQNPQSLQITMPASTLSGFAINVALKIQNNDDSREATQQANLTYQKQL
jgi:hypothetical protein